MNKESSQVYVELEDFLRGFSLSEVESYIRHTLDLNPDYLSVSGLEEAVRDAYLGFVEEEYGRDMARRVRQEMSVLLDRIAQEYIQGRSWRKSTIINEQRIKDEVRESVSKEGGKVTVSGLYRSRSNDVIDPMYKPQLFDEILDEFERQYPSFGRAVRYGLENGQVAVAPDQVELIGKTMKKFMRAEKELFLPREDSTYRDVPTKDTWTNIADKFIQADPDYEPTGWENYSGGPGHRRM